MNKAKWSEAKVVAKTKPVEKPKVEMVAVTRIIGRCGKPPRAVVVRVPKDHPLASGA